MEAFTRSVIKLLKRIPPGKVCTYGSIAAMAGQTNGARQVTRIIHTMSRKHDLPWHRVINAQGGISLPRSGGYEEQKQRLAREGIIFNNKDRVDLETYLWKGQQ